MQKPYNFSSESPPILGKQALSGSKGVAKAVVVLWLLILITLFTGLATANTGVQTRLDMAPNSAAVDRMIFQGVADHRDNIEEGSSTFSSAIWATKIYTSHLPVNLWVVPGEKEPNDIPDQATGPIESGVMYWGKFPDTDDINDYFFFIISAPANVEISLTSIPAGSNYDLVLRDHSKPDPPVGYSANPGNADELIVTDAPLPAGRYDIQVFNRDGTSSTRPYKLMVSYQEILMIADFDTCEPPNNLDGAMGAACPVYGCPPPNTLIERYLPDPEEPTGCIVSLEYHIRDWSAFWMKLQHQDLIPYENLAFDVSGTGDIVGRRMKVELKQDCYLVAGDTVCDGLEIIYVGDITSDWAHKKISISDFEFPKYPDPFHPIVDWSDIEELVFTVEASKSGRDGFIYLDDITLE